MPTLVLPPRFTDDTNAMRKAAIENGWQVERLSSWRPSPELADMDPVLYGEPLFAAVVAAPLRLHLIEPPFDWLASLPMHWLRRRVRFMTLAEATTSEKAFIKPADDKCFPARVYERAEELPNREQLPDTTPTLVSEPVEWLLEFRCFVLERRCITLSPYLRQGQLAQSESGIWLASTEETEQAEEFVNEFLAATEIDVPPAVVVDVGFIAGRGWAVVEANAAWGSGIYGCNPVRVLPVLQRASVSSRNASPTDARWIIRR